MFNIGPAELIVIFLVALLVVGPKRLPEIGRTIGKTLREFRRSADDFKQHFEFDDEDDLPDETPDGHRTTTAGELPSTPPESGPDGPTDPGPARRSADADGHATRSCRRCGNRGGPTCWRPISR